MVDLAIYFLNETVSSFRSQCGFAGWKEAVSFVNIATSGPTRVGTATGRTQGGSEETGGYQRTADAREILSSSGCNRFDIAESHILPLFSHVPYHHEGGDMAPLEMLAEISLSGVSPGFRRLRSCIGSLPRHDHSRGNPGWEMFWRVLRNRQNIAHPHVRSHRGQHHAGGHVLSPKDIADDFIEQLHIAKISTTIQLKSCAVNDYMEKTVSVILEHLNGCANALRDVSTSHLTRLVLSSDRSGLESLL